MYNFFPAKKKKKKNVTCFLPSMNAVSFIRTLIYILKFTIKSVVGMLGKHVQILTNNCSAMSSSVGNVEVDLAKSDQYSRRNTLVVTGLQCKKETETYNTLSSTVADELTTSGIKVSSNNFSACHRNNKNTKTIMIKGKQVKIPPSVTVRFYNANKKDHVLNNYKNYVNGKAKPVRVVQSLDHHYQTLKTNISNLCREKDVKVSWIHWRSASSGLCIKFDNQIILSKIHSMADFNPLVSSVHVRGYQLRGGAIPYENENLTKHWV